MVDSELQWGKDQWFDIVYDVVSLNFSCLIVFIVQN